MPHRHHAPRRALAAAGLCAAFLTIPAGVAEAAQSTGSETSSSQSIVSVTDCGDGLSVTVGGSSLVNVDVPGDDCPSPPSPSPSPYPICTLPPPPTPTPTPTRTTAPAPKPTPTPTHAKPKPTPRVVPPTPPAPSPTPTPTPPRPTPKAAASTPMIAPAATTVHTVPFKHLSTVLVVFVIAIVPVSIARIRHRGR